MKKINQIIIMLLFVTKSIAQQDANIEIISSKEVSQTGPNVSAILNDIENKELASYALDKLKMKVPTKLSVGIAKKVIYQIKDTKTNKTSDLSFTFYDLAPVDINSKATAGVINISDNHGKSYKAIIYAPNGNFENAEEFNVSKGVNGKLSVGNFKSWWNCVKRKSVSCYSPCASAMAQCALESQVNSTNAPNKKNSSWVAFLGCFAVKCGWCYVKATFSCIFA